MNMEGGEGAHVHEGGRERFGWMGGELGLDASLKRAGRTMAMRPMSV